MVERAKVHLMLCVDPGALYGVFKLLSMAFLTGAPTL
jgi:hypothetical protein